MLVEINLLTEKEKKDITLWVIAVILLLLLSIGSSALYLVNKSYQNEIDQLDVQLMTVQQEIATKQQVLEQKPTSYTEQLKTAIEKVEETVIPGSELLREIVRLLPEQGYLLNFNFNHPDTVVFQARFDQISSVAAYNYALNQSSYVSSVILYSINTEVIEIEEEVTEQPFGQSLEELDEVAITDQQLLKDFLPRYVAYFEVKVNRDAFFVKEEDK